MKKLLSIFLTALLLFSTISIGVSAVDETDEPVRISVKQAIAQYESETGEKVKTHRYYFLMPDGTNGEKGDDYSVDENGNVIGSYDKFAPSWYNEYTNAPAIYWWDTGIADPPIYPGYTVEKDYYGVYYAEIPAEVKQIVWNNNIYTSFEEEDPKYQKLMQTINIPCEYYDAGESPNYPDGLEDFDCMIFVIDPDIITINDMCSSSGHSPFGGEWYYYYGGGCYGFTKGGKKSLHCVRDDHDHTQLTTSEAINKYETETGKDVDTNRYYFLMPDGTNGEKGDDNDIIDSLDKFTPSWYNEYTNGPAIYWWDADTTNPELYPGYKADKGDSPSVFYADVPKEVTTIIWNNNMKAPYDKDSPLYKNQRQTINIPCEYYDPRESPNYPNGTTSFDNMIFVIDPDQIVSIGTSFQDRHKPFGGEWYYYYGNGCYGFTENGTTADCLRDDHDHRYDYYAEFLEYLEITEETEHEYSKPLYYHYEDDADTPEWFLVYGYAGCFRPCDIIFGVFGDYYIYNCSSYPSTFDYYIYVMDEQKFYPIEEIWDSDLCGKEEIFTKYLAPEGKAKLLGDADNDGELTIIDATLIQQAEAQYFELEDWIMASQVYGEKIELFTDFDKDGERSVLDATAIQRRLAQLD